MVDINNNNFNSITAKTVKPEESFIDLYVNEWFESKSAISATRRICRILDAKYKNADLNNGKTKQCQHINTEEREQLLILLRKF